MSALQLPFIQGPFLPMDLSASLFLMGKQEEAQGDRHESKRPPKNSLILGGCESLRRRERLRCGDVARSLDVSFAAHLLSQREIWEQH